MTRGGPTTTTPPLESPRCAAGVVLVPLVLLLPVLLRAGDNSRVCVVCAVGPALDAMRL